MLGEDIVLSNEKLSTIHSKCNPKNDRVLAKQVEDIPEDVKKCLSSTKTNFCHGLGSHFQNVEVPFDFCQTRDESQI